MSTRIGNVKEASEMHERFLREIGTQTGCAAKWYQSTLHLQNGLTQSCYNTPQHKIDLEQVKISPLALHNTFEKSVQRDQMKKGLRPAGCEYCWRIEDQKADTLSDRYRWNGYLGNDPDSKSLRDQPANYMFNPKVLEVSFSNLCNFMCGYCHPKNSSRFYNEIKQFGKYQGDSHSCDIHFIKIYDEENNPYLDALWKWWPELSSHLTTIRLTGGEPLIQKSTKLLFEKLLADPRPNLVLSINSNLGMSPKLFREHCATLKKLMDTRSVRRVEIFTSLDTWGPQAEYIRHGLDLKIFEENVNHYLSTFPRFDLSFMVTFNIFSLPNFVQLMQYWLDLKKRFSQKPHRVRADLNILTEPIVFSYLLLPEEYALPAFDRCLEFADRHLDPTSVTGFTDLVGADLRKLRNDYVLNRMDPETLKKHRRDFVVFFDQYDTRKKVDRHKIFPEFVEIMRDWNPASDLAECLPRE